jgi:hypothetical protein
MDGLRRMKEAREEDRKERDKISGGVRRWSRINRWSRDHSKTIGLSHITQRPVPRSKLTRWKMWLPIQMIRRWSLPRTMTLNSTILLVLHTKWRRTRSKVELSQSPLCKWETPLTRSSHINYLYPKANQAFSLSTSTQLPFLPKTQWPKPKRSLMQGRMRIALR